MKVKGLTSSMTIQDQRPRDEILSPHQFPKLWEQRSPLTRKMLLPDGANRPKGASITKVVGKASVRTMTAHFLVTARVAVQDQPSFRTC